MTFRPLSLQCKPPPQFLSPVTGPFSAACQFFLLRNLTAYFCSSSFYLFFGFLTGILSPRLASRIPLVILLSIIVNTCPVHLHFFNMHICKQDVREVHRGCTDWIDLAQNRDRWWAIVNAVMNLRAS